MMPRAFAERAIPVIFALIVAVFAGGGLRFVLHDLVGVDVEVARVAGLAGAALCAIFAYRRFRAIAAEERAADRAESGSSDRHGE
jgi:hypothetical protein